jgi:hypothetical protein
MSANHHISTLTTLLDQVYPCVLIVQYIDLTKAVAIFITINHIVAYNTVIFHDLAFSSSQLAVIILKKEYIIMAKKKKLAAVLSKSIKGFIITSIKLFANVKLIFSSNSTFIK